MAILTLDDCGRVHTLVTASPEYAVKWARAKLAEIAPMPKRMLETFSLNRLAEIAREEGIAWEWSE